MPNAYPHTAAAAHASDDVFAFPASFAQQRLWFLEQLEGERGAHNMAYAFRLVGPLDTASLRQALEMIVSRHEPLRTNFRVQQGALVQVVSPACPLNLPCADLRAVPPNERDEVIATERRAESCRPFDLGRDAMLRASLWQLAGEEHVLLLTVHHIAADGWSIPLLWRELDIAYAAYRRGEKPALPALPIAYADYAVWQRQALQGEPLARLLTFWRAQLAGLPSLELPTDRPRPPQPLHDGARHQFELAPVLVNGLRQISRAEHVTLHMILLAAFQALLARYSGQDDVAVGVPVAGRSKPELEGLIGFFVNTLVVRVDMSGRPTFRDVLARVRRASLDAYDHQELPFEKLVEELNPERHLDRSPVFQVLFQLLNLPNGRPALTGVDVTALPRLGGSARFDLEMHLTSQPDHGVRGTAVYSTDLFDAGRIERLVGHFQTLLEAIVADPDLRIDQVPLLTGAERRQVMVEWNDTACDYPREQSVHQLFEAQVARTPDAVALVARDGQLTYGELDWRAERLAQRLRARGIGPDVPVGICLDRSLSLLVGLLAIWKAGGAYVPLDPSHPAERLAFMLEDSGATVLLTAKSLHGAVPSGSCAVICLDDLDPHEEPAAGIDLSAASIERVATPSPLAYILYTSGSTGRPKGVLVSHRNLVNFLSAMRRQPGMTAADVLVAVTTVSFDIHALELWLPLIVGARVVLAQSSEAADGAALARLLDTSEATVLQATPATWRLLMAADWGGRQGLTALCGGEAFPGDLRQPLRRRVRELWNLYGPTETTVWSTLCRIGDEDGPIGIGRPIANTQAYVLDAHRQLVPIGVPGELYLGGDGLARGYLNLPALTAEHFVADPFGRDSDRRLYRTGDRARWRADGTLECLGRLDDQVKLRGFRIEPGEIETVLQQHPGIAQAIVTVREDRPGDRRLVGYYLPAHGAAPSHSELAHHVARRLPAYMVPSAFVPLTRLPVFANGKVDRRSLPAPDHAGVDASAIYAPPRDVIEAQLAATWADVLGVARVGIHENFFDLGGHSLLAVRLFAEIEKVSGRNFPLATLFEAPTIAQLANMLGRQGWSPNWSPLVAIQPRGRKPALFCVHGVGGNVVGFEALSRHLGTDQPVYGLQAVGLDGAHVPYTRVEDMAAGHVRAVREFQPEGPYFLAGQSFGGLVAFEMARQLHAQGERRVLVLLLDTGPRYRDALSPTRRLSRHARLLVRRIEYHAGAFWRAPGGQRLEQLAAKKRTLKRRGKSAVWRATHQLFKLVADPRQPLPQALRNVEESCWLAARRYVPRPHDGPLVLFLAEQRSLGSHSDPKAVWSLLVTGRLEAHTVPGDHLSILTEPNVRTLALKLTACLAAALPPTTG